MGLSFRRLLLFEGLFEVASLGLGSPLARFLSSPLSASRRRREKEAPLLWQVISYSASCGPLPFLSFLKAPPGTAKIPPADRKAAGRTAAFLLFHSARGVQASGCRLVPGPPQHAGGLRSQRVEGRGVPKGLRGGGPPGASGTSSAAGWKSPCTNSASAHWVVTACASAAKRTGINFGEGPVRPLPLKGRTWILDL